MPGAEVKAEGPPPDWSRQCRAATRDIVGFLANRADDPFPHHDALTVANALREGKFGCRKRPGRALELVDAMIGSPVSMPRDSEALRNYFSWTQDDPPGARREEVFIRSWIVSSSIVSGPCNSPILDEAAARMAERYFRPRLSETVLEGYEGRTVYVPLPAFEFRISTVMRNERAGLSDDASKIVILGRPIRMTN